jgi:hypothetical protein
MEPAVRSGTSDDPAAPAARGGVVSRRVLFERLGRAGRITEVSAPAGGGKTFLLRCWIDEAGLAERAAWVPVQGGQRDPQRFWISVLDALRDTVPGSALVRPVTAAPDLDGWAVVERLLADLGSLEDRIWLVIDDLHELGSAEALRQLELLLMRAPPSLRFLLTTRHDLRLGLHRLRLEGELTEIRAASLRFTLEEARALRASRASVTPAPDSAGAPSTMAVISVVVCGRADGREPAIHPELTEVVRAVEADPVAARPAAPGRPATLTCGRVSTFQARRGVGASSPRARARSTASVRPCAPSFSYRCRTCVRTVFTDRDSWPAISGAGRLVGR